MIIVLHPNTEEYNALNGYRHNSSELLFVKDGSDRYIVGTEVLNDTNFEAIHEQLNQLERIQYTPTPNPFNETTN
jgi:hypothetical protein